MFTNQTKNQEIIHALIKGQSVQYKSKRDKHWQIYDQNWCIENEDPFGPWNCADCYEWRIKPKTTEVTLNLEIVVTKPVTFEFEGVKTELYLRGEDIFYIHKISKSGSYNKEIIRNVNHNEDDKHPSYITFETEEAMNKAYEQIINAQKGL